MGAFLFIAGYSVAHFVATKNVSRFCHRSSRGQNNPHLRTIAINGPNSKQIHDFSDDGLSKFHILAGAFS